MNTPKVIPIPEQMKHLKVDRRGYAIPVSIIIGDDGLPNFTINDELARRRAIRDDSCGLCGKPLFRGRWFVGGPGAAFHPQGAYLDLPMHDACRLYALAACPFLAAPRYGREVAAHQQKRLEAQGFSVHVDDNVDIKRPPLFVAVMATGQRLLEGGQYVKPRRPYSRVEYWRHGVRLDDVEGRAIALQQSEPPISEADIIKSIK